MKKNYVITLLAIEPNDRKIIMSDRTDNEETAINLYFHYEKVQKTIQAEVDKSIEVVLLFDVFCEDSFYNAIERYDFFSKIQSIKDKVRLPFGDITMIIL